MITLYKKDSKGKIRALNIFTEGAELVQRSGLIDGGMVEHRKECKGKNIGKSNETSPENQAISEMNSKITEKLKTDYFKSIDEALNTEVILPMLAHEYDDSTSKKVDWKNTFVQPKLDSMRCFAIVEDGNTQLISRENTDIIEQHNGSVKHLIEHMNKLPNGIYDGELYAHGYSFQECMKMIKKYRPGLSENIKLHCYDFVSEQPFEKRYEELIKRTHNCPAISIVATKQITTEEQLKECHINYISKGYEGTILRQGLEGYRLNKRSNCLLKYKDFIDIAVKIIDVIPMDARPKQGKFVCVLDNGDKFIANLAFSHAEREEALANKQNYIGKTAEVRFFEYTDEGLPRFPACVGIRLDK